MADEWMDGAAVACLWGLARDLICEHQRHPEFVDKIDACTRSDRGYIEKGSLDKII